MAFWPLTSRPRLRTDRHMLKSGHWEETRPRYWKSKHVRARVCSPVPASWLLNFTLPQRSCIIIVFLVVPWLNYTQFEDGVNASSSGIAWTQTQTSRNVVELSVQCCRAAWFWNHQCGGGESFRHRFQRFAHWYGEFWLRRLQGYPFLDEALVQCTGWPVCIAGRKQLTGGGGLWSFRHCTDLLL